MTTARDDTHQTERPGTGGWRGRWSEAQPELGLRLTVVIGLLLVTVGAAGFAAVLDSVQEVDDVAALDEPVLTALAGMRTDAMTTFMTVVTTISGSVVLPVAVVLACAVWGVVRRRWWQAGLLAAAMAASTLVSVTIKAVVARPRPPVDTLALEVTEQTYSFPSGHTIGAATFLLVLGYLVWVRRPRVLLLAVWLVVTGVGILLVATSRLYLGYHFVSDVVASVMLAVSVLGAVVVVDRRRALHGARRTATTAPPVDPGPGPEVSPQT